LLKGKVYSPRQGEIWMVKSQRSDKVRPGVIVSANGYLVADIIKDTDTFEDLIGFDWLSAGLDRKSAVRCKQVNQVDRTDFIRRVGRLKADELKKVSAGCKSIFDVRERSV
jgi:mRNA-degrading endonuclease toxin of MazEF toxin-antitoxin module